MLFLQFVPASTGLQLVAQAGMEILVKYAIATGERQAA